MRGEKPRWKGRAKKFGQGRSKRPLELKGGEDGHLRRELLLRKRGSRKKGERKDRLFGLLL